MNFNPMDLIKVKEYLYEVDSNQYIAVNKFISFLIDIQGKKNMNCKLAEELGESFFKKQEMIELAYKIKKLGDE